MNITLLSIPATVIQTSPEIVSYWLATECPNNFRFKRRDYIITGSAETTGSPANSMEFTVDGQFAGSIGDVISVHNAFNDSMNVGIITDVVNASPESIVTTNIPYNSTFDGDYLNDQTLFNGFYFEGRITVNDVIQPLTIISSPDTFGFADLDVSGLLRIATSLDKNGDNSELVMVETNKSGKFTLEYRPQWYGSDNAYIQESNTWYYVESVRSIEQTSNMSEFVPSAAGDVPFLCSFERPVYFIGFPFDISFLCPSEGFASPPLLSVTITRYNAANQVLATDVQAVDATNMLGRVCSLTIEPDAIETTCTYITAEIDISIPS